MTPDQKISDQRIRQQAQEDVQDIDALASHAPFNRYWVRRLNELYRKETEDALTGKTAELRDGHRYRALLLRELTGLPAADRISAERTLRTPPQAEQRPVQVG